MENLEKNSLFVTEPMYDLSMLEEMDDAEYLLEVLDLLLQETPKDFKELLDGLHSGKADTVYKKAHKLKSSSGIIQAESLTAILGDIEALGKKGIINNELKGLVENAVREYKLIEKSLKDYVEELR